MDTLFGNEMRPEKIINKIQALQTSESNEWYTPRRYVDAARQVMGSIDVDPASCIIANQVVQAQRIYDLSNNGFDKPWSGRVWLNPPYGVTDGKSNQELWTCKLIVQYEAGITTEAILLVNASTETEWFQRLWAYPVCFTNHRIRFYTPETKSNQPTKGNAFVYFGINEMKFIEIFSRFGRIVKAIDAPKLSNTTQSTLWDTIESEVSA